MPPTTVLDLNIPVDASVPLWNETRWSGCWSPASGAGLFIHAGRFRKDLDFWWVHQAAYLPGGRLAVDRFWTPNQAEAGVRSELLNLEMTHTGWRSTYDGVCELTNRDALSRAPRGASAPSARVLWDVTATGRTPAWDMYETVAEEQSFATAMHLQRAFETVGSLHVGDETYELDGVGFYDHSCGARSHSNWSGHRFLLGVMPEYSLHAITPVQPDGTPGKPLGVGFAGDEQFPIRTFDAPPMESVGGEPYNQQILVTGPHGPVTLGLEIVHGFPHTVTADNDHLNGVDWELAGDPLIMVEAIARLTDPDGVVGWAFFERSARRNALPRPE